MHYKNGREAKAGDVILNLQTGKTGVMYDVVAGVAQCSARMAVIGQNDDYISVNRCLHLNDIAASTIPDTTKQPDAQIVPNPPMSDGSPRLGGDVSVVPPTNSSDETV